MPEHIVLDLRNEADANRARAMLGIESKPAETATKKRRSKYNAQPETVDGQRFASRREANRYCVLRALLQAGAIRDLHCQVPFVLSVNGQKICRYIADFVYILTETGETVTEDAKGMRTPVYKLKKRLMLAIHGIVIKEV